MFLELDISWTLAEDEMFLEFLDMYTLTVNIIISESEYTFSKI